MAARVHDDWMPVVIPREEFAREFFTYEPGQHVLFAGPTQMAGKTTLAFKLLEYTATPACPAFVAVSKPKDPVTEREGKRLGYRFVKKWPPDKKVSEIFDGKPPGYVVWPDFGDIDADADRAAEVTGTLMRDRYARGVKDEAGILVCDDTVVKSKLLKLDRYMTTHIAMAGAMDVGGWYFVQKPTDSGSTSIWAFENAAHRFLSKAQDKRNRVRFNDFGSFDGQLVGSVNARLQSYQFQYMNNRGEMCIVDSK